MRHIRPARPDRPARALCSIALMSALVLSVPPALLAQAPVGYPAPGPEQKKLGFFVGKWTTEGEMKPGPAMPGGRITSHDRCEWFEGGFSIVCHYDSIGPTGPTHSLGILGYSSEEKAYTYYSVQSGPTTMASVPLGTEKDGTWVYTDESKMGGKRVKSRYTIIQTSPNSYSYKWEILGDEGAWQMLLLGKSTRAS